MSDIPEYRNKRYEFCEIYGITDSNGNDCDSYQALMNEDKEGQYVKRRDVAKELQKLISEHEDYNGELGFLVPSSELEKFILDLTDEPYED